MSSTQIGPKVQDHTLEAVRWWQDAVVEALTAWTETAQKVTAQLPDFAKGSEFPGFAGFTKLFPTAAEVIDSNFAFAQRILTSQHDFARRLIDASALKTAEITVATPKPVETKVTAPKPAQVKAIAPKPAEAKAAAAPKPAQTKAAAPAKKSAAVKPPAAINEASALPPADTAGN